MGRNKLILNPVKFTHQIDITDRRELRRLAKKFKLKIAEIIRIIIREIDLDKFLEARK